LPDAVDPDLDRHLRQPRHVARLGLLEALHLLEDRGFLGRRVVLEPADPGPDPTTATTRSGNSIAVSNAICPPRELPTSAAARVDPERIQDRDDVGPVRELDVVGPRSRRTRGGRSGGPGTRRSTSGGTIASH
jgi:hypothetical protein